ncbi:MAG: metallophosphoesterase [Lachnospiraceae bacterium]|nr:metallophosphoesterase [Lachnospiraceae bacterium]
MLGYLVVFSIMFVLLSGMSLYISYRVYQGIIVLFPQAKFIYVVIFFAMMLVLMILGFSSSMLSVPVKVKQVVGIVGAYWMGIFVYLLLYAVVIDFIFMLCSMLKIFFVQGSASRGVFSLVTVVLALLTSIYGIYHAQQIKLVSYEVSMENKEDISDMNIVLISDLHLGAVGSEIRLEKIVDEVNQLQPDLVCIAGDFFDTDFASIKNPEKAMRLWKEVKTTYGVYACLGNHDAGKTFPQMQRFLEACNIKILNDEYCIIDDRLVLMGRLDRTPIGGFESMKRKELSEVVICDDETLPVIVMDHNPANISEYTTEADLILSGHTHRGQLFPANIVTNLMYTVDYGYYQENEDSPHVIVTSGVGAWGMPMRVGTDCEIVSIKITGKK